MTTSFLDRPTGRLAYELTGDPDGALIVLSPGMGDLRSTFEGLAERLAAEGARVVTADLRGHGESSTGWDAYGVSAVADDLLGQHAVGVRGADLDRLDGSAHGLAEVATWLGDTPAA